MTLLLYDADCGYCTAAAWIAARLGGIDRQPLQADPSQELLHTVFDAPGFTLYLFEQDTVYWGSAAARRIAEQCHLPLLLVHCIGRLYPSIVRVVSVLTRRIEPVTMPDCTGDRCDLTTTGGTKQLDAPLNLAQYST